MFKTIVIGNSGVGKTSLIARLNDRDYKIRDFIPTIGVDFIIKRSDINGIKIRQ